MRRSFVAVALGAALFFGVGVAWLFSGGDVSCVESEAGAPVELRCGFEIAAPPEAAWQAFTRTGVPRPFYFDAVLEAEMRPGGRWRFVTDDRERLLAGGEILVLEPPRRFSQTFAAADLDDRPSRITVEIEPLEGGSSVTLVHAGFEGRTTTYRRFRKAHPLALSALRAQLERGEIPFRARLYTVLFKPGMKLFTVRAEPWEPPAPKAVP